MDISVFDKSFDEVISSVFTSAKTNYRFANEVLFLLIDNLEIQRRVQDVKFYERLADDILKGCVMPPLTLAIIEDNFDAEIWKTKSIEEIQTFIQENIQQAFVLDGIQRLNILHNTSLAFTETDWHRNLYFNLLICGSIDNLLYRMITLNNGQKPMTPRHQIEMLTHNLYDFDNMNLPIHTEKRQKRKLKESFERADFVKAYLAFLSNSIDIDNQKIIQEKLDELLANRIIQENIPQKTASFEQVLTLIERLITFPNTLKWFQNPNHLIGFCVGIISSFTYLKDISSDNFSKKITHYQEAFDALKIQSRFKVPHYQRVISKYFISDYQEVEKMDLDDLIPLFANKIN